MEGVGTDFACDMGMAYLARRDILFGGALFHVTWQCHNRDWFLQDNSAKDVYYNLLLKHKDKYGVQIFSWCLMDNHPHLTGKTETVEGISMLMKVVNSLFAKWVNKLKNRQGQVIMDRFKSPVIQTGEQLLKVMIYGDMNAVRAGKVKHPKMYRWSSYHFYAHGKPDPLITPCQAFLSLGADIQACQKRYREMVDGVIQNDLERKQRQNYSHVLYIGDPGWVKARYERLQEINRCKRQAYLQRQKRFLYSQAPF